jgi:hypothetical protein
MVTPVWREPSAIGQLMEDGPRCLGSSEGWNWIVPWRGMFTKDCGANYST